MRMQPALQAPPPAIASSGRPARHRLWIFPKEGRERLSANFAAEEFRCRCDDPSCHLTLVSPKLVDVLQTLRELIAAPLVVSSGYRCLRHNAAVGGAARSFHTWGMAADLRCGDEALLRELVEHARRIPLIGGIGRYPAAGFAHIDVRPRGADGNPITWSA